MLIKLLIVFFIFLIGYQLFLFIFKKDNLVEGLENDEYKPYNKDDPNNTLILAQQNAGNIEVLKGRVDKLDGIKERVDSLQQLADGMQTQIDGLVQQQADYANDLMGDKPPPLEGTEGYDADTAVADMEEEEEPESEPVNL
jgi:Tfp pilus assembly protein PilO